jgi:hypothetical protein
MLSFALEVMIIGNRARTPNPRLPSFGAFGGISGGIADSHGAEKRTLTSS